MKISLESALEKIEATRGKGTIFGVSFIKRSDNSNRNMSCRLGVTKGVLGVGLAFDPAKKNLKTVYDMNKGGFRMINLEGLHRLKVDGNEFEVLP